MSLSDLVLSIADNKQMLGLRYAEWATRAPSLEADIAAAAMGLDDLGHSRVLYGCLEPLGADPRGPERESDPAGLRALAYFDEPWTEWAQFVAANAVLDTAFTAMIEACVSGSVEVLQHRLRKMLMEERYHFLHGRSWLKSGIGAEPLNRAWTEGRFEREIVAVCIDGWRNEHGTAHASRVHFAQHFIRFERHFSMHVSRSPWTLGRVRCPDMNLCIGDKHEFSFFMNAWSVPYCGPYAAREARRAGRMN